jgi:hypothetical protein
MTENIKHTQLLTVNQFVEKHQFATFGGLRHLIFYADTNGFSKVIKRIGRRILLDESAFFEWIEENNKNKEVGDVGKSQ